MRPRTWALPLIGAAAAALGLVPWLVHGGALPLQNLAEAGAAGRPFVLLPFSQYAISGLAALLVAGGAIAGLGARALGGASTLGRRALLLAGVLLVQTVAIVQTAQAVGGVLQQRRESALYLGLLVGGSVVSVLLGAAVLLLVAARARAAVVVGVALVAPLVASWAGMLLTAPTDLYTGPTWPFAVLPWLAPIAVGVAVARSGVRTVGRIAATVFAAIALWIGPALVTAVTSAAGARVYARYPAEMLRFGLDVLRSALTALDLVVPVLLVAAVIAVAGIVARTLATRRAAETEGPQAT